MEEEYSGKKLRFYRSEKGWTQLRLAVEMGLYPSQVSRIECGSQRFGKIHALAAAYVLGVDVGRFVTCESQYHKRRQGKGGVV